MIEYPILIPLADETDQQDEAERADGSEGAEAREDGDGLEDGVGEEDDVGEAQELKEDALRQESDRRVLGRENTVVVEGAVHCPEPNRSF